MKTTIKKIWQLVIVSLVVVLLLVTTFALKTYAPNGTAKKAVAATPAKVTAKGTPVSMPYHERADSPVLSHASQESQKRFVKNYGKLPLSFEANRGQTDPQVKFLTRGPGYSVFLTSGGMALTLRPSKITDSQHASSSADVPALSSSAASLTRAPTGTPSAWRPCSSSRSRPTTWRPHWPRSR